MEESKIAYVSPEFISNGEPCDTTSARASGAPSMDDYERMMRAL